jgi:hypothetical protein
MHVRGKLYYYHRKNELNFNWANLIWSENEQLWVLDSKNIRWTSVEDRAPCIYLGRAKGVRMGAFLVGDQVLSIDIGHVKR